MLYSTFHFFLLCFRSLLKGAIYFKTAYRFSVVDTTQHTEKRYESNTIRLKAHPRSLPQLPQLPQPAALVSPEIV